MGNYSDVDLLDFVENGEQDSDIQLALDQDPSLKRRLEELKMVADLMAESSSFQPPKSLKEGFMRELSAEPERPRTFQIQWPSIAAAILLLIAGYGFGRISNQNNSDEERQLLQEVSMLKELLLASQLKEPSASTRLQVVNSIENLESEPSEALVKVLIQTACSDKSPNVRYEAVQALGDFIEYAAVRDGLLQTLEYQDDALIQIAIIQLLVEAEEKSAISTMQKLLESEETSPEVKKQAEIAIEILI